MVFMKEKANLNASQINYESIKEKNSTIVLCQKWLDDNDILMYSTHNEGKPIVTERFTKALKGKIYKKWQLLIKNLHGYLNKLVDKCNNT